MDRKVMQDTQRHLIRKNATIKEALQKLNDLAADAILFVINDEQKLIGSLTDGDVRRGLLKGLTLDALVNEFIQPNPRFIKKGEYTINEIINYKKNNLRILPVVDKEHRIINIVNFRFLRSYLPIDVVIMAGGRGERLRPLTDKMPKPLLKVGEKPIIEHNIDHLIS